MRRSTRHSIDGLSCCGASPKSAALELTGRKPLAFLFAITHCQPLYAARCFTNPFSASTGNPTNKSKGLPWFYPVHEFTIEFEASDGGLRLVPCPPRRKASLPHMHLPSILLTHSPLEAGFSLAHKLPNSTNKKDCHPRGHSEMAKTSPSSTWPFSSSRVRCSRSSSVLSCTSRKSAR